MLDRRKVQKERQAAQGIGFYRFEVIGALKFRA